MSPSRIIPSLFSYTQKEFEKKLRYFSFASRLHIDFMDGEFTEKASLSFDEMEMIKEYPLVEFEAHLMAYDPGQYVTKIKKLGISKVLLQFEAFETDSELQDAIDRFRSKDIEVALVINPGTEVEELVPYLDDVDSVMLMSVWPGREGQEFISNTYERLEELREVAQGKRIQVDGGITGDNVKQISEKGCDWFVVGSYLSKSADPKAAFKELEVKLT